MISCLSRKRCVWSCHLAAHLQEPSRYPLIHVLGNQHLPCVALEHRAHPRLWNNRGSLCPLGHDMCSLPHAGEMASQLATWKIMFYSGWVRVQVVWSTGPGVASLGSSDSGRFAGLSMCLIEAIKQCWRWTHLGNIQNYGWILILPFTKCLTLGLFLLTFRWGSIFLSVSQYDNTYFTEFLCILQEMMHAKVWKKW